MNTNTTGSEERIKSWRSQMVFMLILADATSFTMSWLLALLTRYFLRNEVFPVIYIGSLGFLIPLMILVNYAMGLYKHNISDVDELRRLSKSTFSYFFIALSVLFLLQKGYYVSRMVVAFAWVYMMVLGPIVREILRMNLIRSKKWGEPVIIFGNGKLANEVADYLDNNPRTGYYPVAMVDHKNDNPSLTSVRRVLNNTNVFFEATRPAWMKHVRTVFLITTEVSKAVHEMLIERQEIRFEKIILVTSPQKNGSIWVQPLDIGGILGLEVGQNLLNQTQKKIKRFTDILIILLALPILVPLFVIIGMLIKIDSKGSIFYTQVRIGSGGKTYKIIKFRSMVQEADKKLSTYLEANPEMRKEYEQYHKLKNDPRITRVGKYLRKFSIDELPQIINVLKGEMSLVGPRPFMPEETGFYNQCYSLYTYVKPGITGLWQISGRSSTSYNTRVNLDDYYLRNWSIWLDVLIFARTIGVVLGSKNSY